MTMYDIVNQGMYDSQTRRAAAAAQAAYQMALAGNQSEQMALARAQFEWNKELDRAAQTGMWEGQWNNPQEQWFTGQFGQWFGAGGAPAVGQQTLGAQQQGFQQGLDTSQLYGQYYAPGTAPTQGQQTLAAQNQALTNAANVAALTGYYNAPGATGQGTQTLTGQQQQFAQGLQTMQEQRAAQAQQQSQAMNYLNLLSNLRGPADWAKYQQVLGSTPNGLRDLTAAAMGQYVPGGGATTGMQPQAVSLQSLMGQVSGNPYTGQGGGQLNMPSVYGGGQASYGAQLPYQPAQWQAASGAQQQMITDPGFNPAAALQRSVGGAAAAPAEGTMHAGGSGGFNESTGQYDGGAGMANAAAQRWGQASTGQQQMITDPGFNPGAADQRWGAINYGGNNAAAGAALGGAGAAPGSSANNGLGQMPLPNQISAQSWKNFTPTQQQMYLGAYENAGWDKNDVTALMNQALPRYASNAPSAGTWRM